MKLLNASTRGPCTKRWPSSRQDRRPPGNEPIPGARGREAWAGAYRTHELSIGNRRRSRFPNAWQFEARRPAEDICVELHHGLTQVHAFVNGNGRHARLVTDLFAQASGLGDAATTWGSGHADPKDRRQAYLEALRNADRGSTGLLRGFMFN